MFSKLCESGRKLDNGTIIIISVFKPAPPPPPKKNTNKKKKKQKHTHKTNKQKTLKTSTLNISMLRGLWRPENLHSSHTHKITPYSTHVYM